MTLAYDQFTNRPEHERYLTIWAALTEDADFSTPEGRYAFDNVLRAFLETITPTGLRTHYAAMYRNMRAMEFAMATDDPGNIV